MRPVDIATEDTVKFIQATLSPGSKRLLEVGCGRGELALALQDLGYEIIALDASPEAIEAAKGLGVDARQVQWPDFEAAPFDAILFTNSLHHIGPLAAAVDQAKKLLAPGGKVIVVDFDVEVLDLKTSEWFYGLALALKSGKLIAETGGMLPGFLEQNGPYHFWAHQRHGHDLHLMPAIKAELERVFSTISEATSPHMYRYFLPSLPQDDKGVEIAHSIYAAEKRLGDAGGICLIGRWFVSTN